MTIDPMLTFIGRNLLCSALLSIPVLLLGVIRSVEPKFKYRIFLLIFILIPFASFLRLPSNIYKTEAAVSSQVFGFSAPPAVEESGAESDGIIKSYREDDQSAAERSGGASVPHLVRREGNPDQIRKRTLKGISIFPVFSVTYGLVAIFLFVRLFRSFIYLGKLKKAGVQCSDRQTLSLMKSISRHMGINKDIELILIPAVQVPFSFGIFKKYIALPYDSTLNFETMRQILTHEAAHIKRKDYTVNIIQKVYEIALWYNPLVWWLSGSLTAAREMDCDNYVVSHMENPGDYAATLLNSLMMKWTGQPLPCNGSAGSSRDLKRRISHIMKGRFSVRRKRAPIAAASLLALFLAIIGFIAYMNSGKDLGYTDYIQLEKPIRKEAAELINRIYRTKWDILDRTGETASETLREIEALEKGMRREKDSVSMRSLSYLLMFKSEIQKLSERRGLQVNWWDNQYLGKEVLEALELIHRDGDAQDKGNIIALAGMMTYDREERRTLYEKALAQYTGAGYLEGMARLRLYLAGIELEFRIPEDLDEQLRMPVAWAEKEGDPALLASAEGMSDLKLILERSSEDPVYHIYGGFVLEETEKGDLREIPDLSAFTGARSGSRSEYSDVNPINDALMITGELYVPGPGGIEPDHKPGQPLGNITTEVIEIESAGTIEIKSGFPAKKYNEVLRIKYLTELSEPENRAAILGGGYAGVREIWYARGIGIIKYTVENRGGSKSVYLSDCTLNSDSHSYFPLDEGNEWVYRTEGDNRGGAEWHYRISGKEGSRAYFSFCGYEWTTQNK